MKVSAVYNEHNKVVKNQYTFTDNGCEYFQSYDQIVVKLEKDLIFLDENWARSKTTAKYRNRFLNLSTSKILEYITSGEILVMNLNE